MNIQEFRNRLDPNRHRREIAARRSLPQSEALQRHREQAQIAQISPPPCVLAIPQPGAVEAVSVRWSEVSGGEGTDSLLIVGHTAKGERPLARIPADASTPPQVTAQLLEDAASYLGARGVLQQPHFDAIIQSYQQPPHDIAVRRSMEEHLQTPHERVRHTFQRDWVKPAIERGKGSGMKVVEKAKSWLRR